ncbi:MAG: sulfotransferase domain-containing protein [Candidatus Aureabacteria bacterium]|nr:sulfotransferase domain-containing protein [Candidatus Auribacterota bacterium]
MMQLGKFFLRNTSWYYLYRYLKYLQEFGVSNRCINCPEKDIVVCGMPRSGSTLLYNILKIILTKTLEMEDGFCFVEKEYTNKMNNQNIYHLRKIHIFSFLLAKRIKTDKTIGFFTHRDIRDVIVSLIQKKWITDFDEFIESGRLHRIVYTSLLYAKTKNMHVFSYDELLHNKEEAMRRVLRILNLELDTTLIEHLIKETSIGNTQRKIAQNKYIIKSDKVIYNPATGLHKNHIQDPRTGKWKEFLSREQIKIVNKIAKEYIYFFNYE